MLNPFFYLQIRHACRMFRLNAQQYGSDFISYYEQKIKDVFDLYEPVNELEYE